MRAYWMKIAANFLTISVSQQPKQHRRPFSQRPRAQAKSAAPAPPVHLLPFASDDRLSRLPPLASQPLSLVVVLLREEAPALQSSSSAPIWHVQAGRGPTRGAVSMRRGSLDQGLKGRGGRWRWGESAHLMLARKSDTPREQCGWRGRTSPRYQVLHRRGAEGSTLSRPTARTAQPTHCNVPVGDAYKSMA